VAVGGVDRAEHDLVPENEVLVQRVQPDLADPLAVGRCR
jgi:hypothetical protein